MNRKSRLTARQGEALQWLQDGCPDGVWRGFTYKTTIYALEARGLATVDRRRNSWCASLTDAGRFYLAHGRYPDGNLHAGADVLGSAAPGVDGPVAELLARRKRRRGNLSVRVDTVTLLVIA